MRLQWRDIGGCAAGKISSHRSLQVACIASLIAPKCSRPSTSGTGHSLPVDYESPNTKA